MYISTLLSLLPLASAVLAQSSNNASASSASSRTPTSSSSSSSSSTASSTTQAAPSYSAASGTAYSNATASALASSLPGYTYNLTEESINTRIGICNQTTQFCASSKCTSSSANVTSNFCNPTTMGWNCACNNGATSRLQPLVVPVNTYDCRLRTSACLQACQNPKADPPVNSTTDCSNACNYVLGATCGTSAQVLPLYRVDNYDDAPKYYIDTSKGGAAAGINTASKGAVMVAPLFSLVLGALGGGVWLFAR